MATVALVKDVVFDCEHRASLARFWAGAVDGYEVAPYDEAELARLRQMGVDDPEDDPGVLVESSRPGHPRLYLQKASGDIALHRSDARRAASGPAEQHVGSLAKHTEPPGSGKSRKRRSTFTARARRTFTAAILPA